MKKIVTVILTLFSLSLLASIPDLIPVQGSLTDGEGNAINENVKLTFQLFSSESSETVLWSEERTGFEIKNGYYSAYLGKFEPLLAVVRTNPNLWLEIIVNDESMGRIQLGAVPFAMKASSAESLGSLGESTLTTFMTSSCDENQYLQGWDSNYNPICQTDEKGEDMLSHNHDTTYYNIEVTHESGKLIKFGDKSLSNSSLYDDGAIVSTGSAKLEAGGVFTANSTVNLMENTNVYGNLTIDDTDETDAIYFGNKKRQMLNLWGKEYGIGIQSGVQYFRTVFNFAWFKGGIHNDDMLNPGGGFTLMTLDPNGNLVVSGAVAAAEPTDNSHLTTKAYVDSQLAARDATMTTPRKTWSANSEGNSTIITEEDIITYCGDEDGCKIRLMMINHDGSGRTSSKEFLLFYNSNGNWKSSNDSIGSSGSNSTEHVSAQWNECILTDGYYSGGVDQGDNDKNFSLTNWIGYNAQCRLTMID